MNKKTKKELLKENEDLRARLQEEHEYLQAIRNGEIDALVVSGPSGEQIYTLREADKPYRIIVEEMKEGTVTLSDDGLILYSNKQFARMLKIPLSKLMGTSFFNYIDPAHEETIRLLLSKNETKRAEVVFETSDHEQVSAYVSFSPLDIENAPVFLGVIADVTNEIRLEQQVRQMQKMEALGRLAGGIAHDLNNILSPIILNSEMLADDEGSDPDIRQSLHEILTAAYRQRDLVKQILAFSRKGDQKLKPVRVIPLVEEALKLMRSSLPTTIEINHNLQLQTGADTVLGDQTQIHQVIMNLFTNAADSIAGRAGKITVSLDVVHLESMRRYQDLKPGKYLQLIVRDTGNGMTHDVMEHIFEPFFTTKEQTQGCGMGLSVVHGIIKHHGGAIMVKSEPGRGSQFIVLLPLFEKNVRQHDVPGECASPVKGKRILLVDDEDLVLSCVQRSLDRLGYHVDTAKDVQEALRIFRKAPDEFDVVITDHTMPHMTGAQLAEEVISMRSDMPIILYTGYSEVITQQDAKEKGIREVLLKPVSTKELNEAICRVLEH